jgi:hypothetical protein
VVGRTLGGCWKLRPRNIVLIKRGVKKIYIMGVRNVRILVDEN